MNHSYFWSIYKLYFELLLSVRIEFENEWFEVKEIKIKISFFLFRIIPQRAAAVFASQETCQSQIVSLSLKSLPPLFLSLSLSLSLSHTHTHFSPFKSVVVVCVGPTETLLILTRTSPPLSLSLFLSHSLSSSLYDSHTLLHSSHSPPLSSSFKVFEKQSLLGRYVVR